MKVCVSCRSSDRIYVVVEYERLTEDRILRRHGIFELHRRRTNKKERNRMAFNAVDRGSHAVHHLDWET